MLIVGIVTAVAVPLLFLVLVRWLDLYASGSFHNVLLCAGWGGVAFWLAYQINITIGTPFGTALMITFIAPVVEEICKSLVLVYIVRRPNFTYFVDGAIYGFAAGACFAVLENLLYLSSADASTGLALGFGRAFSSALMHGSATALVGIVLGRLRYGRGASRFASLFLGWAAAMLLHISFNQVVYRMNGPYILPLAILLGLSGVGMIAAFIFWGLAEERRWLRETLGMAVGVSVGESAVVQQLDNLDPLLAPVAEHFGAEKRKQVEDFLKLQAQLGLKRKVQQITPDVKQRAEMEKQVAMLRGEIDAVRRTLGVYCMAYVRSILPPEAKPMWARLGQTIENRDLEGSDLDRQTSEPGAAVSSSGLWAAIENKMEE